MCTTIPKGEKNGECNRTACSTKKATFYNHSTRKYYCTPCARIINMHNKVDAMRLYGHDLCTLEENVPSENTQANG